MSQRGGTGVEVSRHTCNESQETGVRVFTRSPDFTHAGVSYTPCKSKAAASIIYETPARNLQPPASFQLLGEGAERSV